jgi:hypothetical protein
MMWVTLFLDHRGPVAQCLRRFVEYSSPYTGPTPEKARAWRALISTLPWMDNSVPASLGKIPTHKPDRGPGRLFASSSSK